MRRIKGEKSAAYITDVMQEKGKKSQPVFSRPGDEKAEMGGERNVICSYGRKSNLLIPVDKKRTKTGSLYRLDQGSTGQREKPPLWGQEEENLKGGPHLLP